MLLLHVVMEAGFQLKQRTAHFTLKILVGAGVTMLPLDVKIQQYLFGAGVVAQLAPVLRPASLLVLPKLGPAVEKVSTGLAVEHAPVGRGQGVRARSVAHLGVQRDHGGAAAGEGAVGTRVTGGRGVRGTGHHPGAGAALQPQVQRELLLEVEHQTAEVTLRKVWEVALFQMFGKIFTVRESLRALWTAWVVLAYLVKL